MLILLKLNEIHAGVQRAINAYLLLTPHTPQVFCLMKRQKTPKQKENKSTFNLNEN